MKEIENPSEVVICRFDGVDAAGVYVGTMDNLQCVNDELNWREDKSAGDVAFGPYYVLTLDEIAEQLEWKTYSMITVIVEGPMSGAIYRYGNYSDKQWWQVGDLDGYA